MLSFVSWPREVLVWLLNVFEGVLNQIYIIALLLPTSFSNPHLFYKSGLDPVKIINADPDIDINLFSFLIFVPHGPKFD
jgi:hypothetical protein